MPSLGAYRPLPYRGSLAVAPTRTRGSGLTEPEKVLLFFCWIPFRTELCPSGQRTLTVSFCWVLSRILNEAFH
ncbi:hypothetical protein ATANTOWER_003566 [Ataeniobius toweri]|uniref:Uncharacterized protein n=1 Tax=Ataeniobius toweri TaxID=208326 RepID=A0ABU7CEH3_9TELE|nr:hypothetical protein [Ataeniobius toweri]